MIKRVIDYILPNRCIACLKLSSDNEGICAECFMKLNFISSPYCQKCGSPFEFKIEHQLVCTKCVINPQKYFLARSLLRFDEESKKIIHNFKYNDATENADIFAKMIIARYAKDFQGVNIIAPVPMNRFKRIFRRYNPAQILAKSLSQRMNVSFIPDLLIKTKWTKAQTNLNKAQREKNLQNSISMNPLYTDKKQNRTLKVLLVDDVRTTGATCDNCVNVLQKAGVQEIRFITIGAT
ncbi:MAG: hypothetical protein DGJ47_000455 [Rickettsiaceae bacterium]